MSATTNRLYPLTPDLTALTGTDNVADAELEAQRMVDAYEQAHDTDALWDAVRATTRSSLRKTYESGLLSQENCLLLNMVDTIFITIMSYSHKDCIFTI